MLSTKNVFGIPLNKKVLFLCTSPRDVKSTLSLVVNAIKISKSKPFLVIKLHPMAMENKINFNDFGLSKLRDFVIINGYTDKLILISDVVISQLSTVALESVLMCKPHIIISKDLGLRNSFIFSQQPLIMHTDNYKEASHIIDKLLSSDNKNDELYENRRIFLKKYFNNEDGCALNRVNDFLVSL